jgi:pimeloyl-ACP methyl ester carboxylesterase
MVEQGVEHMAATGPEVLLGDFLACDNFDLCGSLEQISLPTLVLVGDQDKMSPQKYSRFLVEHIPGAQMTVVPGGGHMVNLEQPRAFNQALAGFLTNLTGNPAWGKASS